MAAIGIANIQLETISSDVAKRIRPVAPMTLQATEPTDIIICPKPSIGMTSNIICCNVGSGVSQPGRYGASVNKMDVAKVEITAPRYIDL